MANINKIRLSGQTYNIQDENATKTVELTQAQYDALTVKDPNTFYVITDAQGADLSNYYTKSETSGATEISTALSSKADTATTYTKTETDNAITAATSTKQDTLVSGTNIKTINNESILGSGNINIQGGGSSYTAGDGIDITNGVISVTGKIDTTTYNTYTAATNSRLSEDEEVTAAALNNINDRLSEDEEVTAAGLNALNESLNGKADTTAFTAHTADTTIHVTSSDKSSWNGAATNASNAVTALGGLKLQQITQSAYDALVTKDSSTLYIIVN